MMSRAEAAEWVVRWEGIGETYRYPWFARVLSAGQGERESVAFLGTNS